MISNYLPLLSQADVVVELGDLVGEHGVVQVVLLLKVETGDIPGDFSVILQASIRCYHGAEALMLYNLDPPLPACLRKIDNKLKQMNIYFTSEVPRSWS